MCERNAMNKTYPPCVSLTQWDAKLAIFFLQMDLTIWMELSIWYSIVLKYIFDGILETNPLEAKISNQNRCSHFGLALLSPYLAVPLDSTFFNKTKFNSIS